MTASATPDSPKTSDDFDAAYRAAFTFWGDVRVPKELKELASKYPAKTILELGCGIGRFSQYMAEHGLLATGVDFSPVAIRKAQRRVAGKSRQATYLTADVTRLAVPGGPFDAAFDVGCLHCLDAAGQAAYASGVASHLAPGSTLLVWAMDHAPSGMTLSPGALAPVFDERFRLIRSEKSTRRFAASHWLWFERRNT